MTNVTSNGALSSISAGSTTSSSLSGSGSASGGLGQLNQADFIKLLTAQLQNQDPTSPTKPQDLANEFAQLSTVSGITSLNAKISQIQNGAGAAQIGQAGLLIGKTVTINGGSTVTANGNGDLNGAFSLASSASNATVSVTDPATGKVVQQIALTNLSPGMNEFSWNGATPSHAYQYAVTASNGTSTVQGTTYTSGAVTSVNLSGGTPTLSVAGVGNPIDLTQIVSIIGG